MMPPAVAEASAQANQDPQQLAQQGLEHFYNLEYDPAIALFERLRKAEPDDPTWYNHLAMAYFYKQLYVAGALQGDLFSASNRFFRKKVEFDPALKQRFWEANEAAARFCEQRLKKNGKDQEALYACGVAYATRSTFQGLVERAKLAFISNGNKANDYHSRLLKLNPRYYDAYLVPGVYDFVLGSLPAPLKFLLYFAGLSGDKERGLQAVQSAAQWGEHAREDAKIVLTVMYRREKRYSEARRTLQELAHAFPRNYLVPLEIASLYRASEDLKEAIREYEQALEDTRRGKPGYQDVPVARIHYELGELYRKIGELESARNHFSQVAGSKGSTSELEKESSLLRQQIEQLLQQAEPAPKSPPAGTAALPPSPTP
ncbi:MAG: DUF3808 domain-containing protein [Acidobacteria bacterium]|nr:DUF3808 domain-containing protein [Acidobacteriota bacterium]